VRRRRDTRPWDNVRLTTEVTMDVNVAAAGAGRLLRLAIIVVLALGAVSCAITTVETGHVGVTTLFGRVTGERLYEGIHLINPL
jgi:regulator of protease activity HflC (stomatin/prohibitin superfamily)